MILYRIPDVNPLLPCSTRPQNLIKERTVAATMTLRLKKTTQAELVDDLFKGKVVKPQSSKSPILVHR